MTQRSLELTVEVERTEFAMHFSQVNLHLYFENVDATVLAVVLAFGRVIAPVALYPALFAVDVVGFVPKSALPGVADEWLPPRPACGHLAVEYLVENMTDPSQAY